MNSSILVILFNSSSPRCLTSKKFIDSYSELNETILSWNSNIKLVFIESKNIHGRFNENKYPSYLLRYNSKFPNLILIPHPLWNIAIDHLGCNSNVLLTLSVKSFASISKTPTINNIMTWLKNSYDDEFKTYNNMSKDELLSTHYNDIFIQQPRIEISETVLSSNCEPSICNTLSNIFLAFWLPQSSSSNRSDGLGPSSLSYSSNRSDVLGPSSLSKNIRTMLSLSASEDIDIRSRMYDYFCVIL